MHETVHDTPWSELQSEQLPGLGLGLAATCQTAPFHVSTSVPRVERPTAAHDVGEAHETPYK
jgi:hypothetical protein